MTTSGEVVQNLSGGCWDPRFGVDLLTAGGGGAEWPTVPVGQLASDGESSSDDAPESTTACSPDTRGIPTPLDAYEILIDKMLSLPPQRAILELVPDRGAEPRPDGL